MPNTSPVHSTLPGSVPQGTSSAANFLATGPDLKAPPISRLAKATGSMGCPPFGHPLAGVGDHDIRSREAGGFSMKLWTPVYAPASSVSELPGYLHEPTIRLPLGANEVSSLANGMNGWEGKVSRPRSQSDVQGRITCEQLVYTAREKPVGTFPQKMWTTTRTPKRLIKPVHNSPTFPAFPPIASTGLPTPSSLICTPLDCHLSAVSTAPTITTTIYITNK